MIANSINRAFGRASLRGVARVYTRLSQLSRVRSSTLLATRPWRVCGGARTPGTQLATGFSGGFTSPA